MSAILRHALPDGVPLPPEHALIRYFLEWQGVGLEYERVSRLVGCFTEVVIDGGIVVHGFWELVNLWQEKGWQRI